MAKNFDPQTGEPIKQTTETKTTNGLAIAGFVLSFASSILGLIFSILGLNEAKKTNNGRGLAIAGIIISVVKLVAVICLFVFFLFMWGFIWDEVKDDINLSTQCAMADKCVDNGDGTSECTYKSESGWKVTITCDNDYLTTDEEPTTDSKHVYKSKEITLEGQTETVSIEVIKSELGYTIESQNYTFEYEAGTTSDKFVFVYNPNIYFTVEKVDPSYKAANANETVISNGTKAFKVTTVYPEGTEYAEGIVARMLIDIDSISIN